MKMPERCAAVLVAVCLASGGCFGTRHRQAGIKGGGRVVAFEVTGLSMMGIGALSALMVADSPEDLENEDEAYAVFGSIAALGAVLCLVGEAINNAAPVGHRRASVVVTPVGASLAVRF